MSLKDTNGIESRAHDQTSDVRVPGHSTGERSDDSINPCSYVSIYPAEMRKDGI